MLLEKNMITLNDIVKALELGIGSEHNDGVSFTKKGNTATLYVVSMGRNTGEQEESSNCYYQTEHIDYLELPWWADALKKATKLFGQFTPAHLQDPRLHFFYQKAANDFYRKDTYWLALMPPPLEILLKRNNAHFPDLEKIARNVLADTSPVAIDDHVRLLREEIKDYLFEKTKNSYWFYDGSNLRVIPTNNFLAKDYRAVASEIIPLLPALEAHLHGIIPQ